MKKVLLKFSCVMLTMVLVLTLMPLSAISAEEAPLYDYERDGSFSTKKGDRWQMFDVGAACQTFCLAAHEQGLGTVIMGIWDEDGITALLQIPENQELAALIAIGYPDTEPDAPKRKSVDDLLTYR